MWVLALGGATPNVAVAATEGRNGQIAFDARVGRGDSDLYVASPDGTGERRLPISATGANDSRPAWAPPGAFNGSASPLASGPTVTFDLSKPQAHPVTGVSFNGVPASSYSVDPTSSPVTVTATVPADAKSGPVCVIRSAGYVAAPNLVLSVEVGILPGSTGSGPGCDNSQPLAFQSDRTGDYDIWAANPNDPGSTVDLVPWQGSNETQPAWSDTTDVGVTIADGRTAPLLAFTSDRAGNRDIYILDTGQPYRPGINPSRVTTSLADDSNPDFSLSGAYLTFQSDRDGQSDIWVMRVQRNASGGFVPEKGLVKITPDQPPSFDPSWFWFTDNPTVYSAIAFSGPDENGTCGINHVAWPTTDDVPPPDPAALDTWTLDDAPGGADSPSWSPLGDALSFQAGDSQTTGIFSLSTDDKTPVSAHLVSSILGRARHPTWQALPYEANPQFYRPFYRRHKRRHRSKGQIAQAAQAPAQCAAAPAARLNTRPASPKVGQTVTLDATASQTPGGRIDHYEWDLDANGTYEARTAGPTLTTNWRTAGNHTVAVRITDDDGATDIARRVVTVMSTNNVKQQPPLGRCTKVGTPGPDRLQGTSGRDVLCGLGGNDILLGNGGNDVLVGGPGKDRLYGGPGTDVLRGGGGNDGLWGGTGRDRLYGDSGRDRLDGQAGDDRLWGGANGDVLAGGAGKDRLWGGANSDVLAGGAGNDRLWGGARGDVLTGGGGSDELRGQGGDDRLLAKDGRRDLVDGGTQHDRATVDRGLDRVRHVELLR
jgi:Ca2+-binding RTX toxin-like protein